jgi:hypothetical protein
MPAIWSLSPIWASSISVRARVRSGDGPGWVRGVGRVDAMEGPKKVVRRSRAFMTLRRYTKHVGRPAEQNFLTQEPSGTHPVHPAQEFAPRVLPNSGVVTIVAIAHVATATRRTARQACAAEVYERSIREAGRSQAAPSRIKGMDPTPMAASANVLEQPLSGVYVLREPGTLVAR